jgi:hypothetical protein
MARKIIRLEVPVEDKNFNFNLSGEVLFVDSTKMEVVEMWVESFSDRTTRQRKFRVFGTGQIIPDDAIYVGTTTRAPEGQVWHLFEVLS